MNRWLCRIDACQVSVLSKCSFMQTIPVSFMVARWFVFNPKIPIWEKFSGPQVGKCWYILWPFGIFYGYLGYSMTIRQILCSFGTFFQFWYHAPRKIWQPWSHKQRTVQIQLCLQVPTYLPNITLAKLPAYATTAVRKIDSRSPYLTLYI
jgi:hypothetical protein